jgi:exopolysaccharide biosynthesis polyprenyl glycosylphosphotransferase
MAIARSHLIINGHRAVDLLLTAVAFSGSYFMKKYLDLGIYRGISQDPNYWAVLFLVLISWYISFNLFGIYGSYRNRSLSRIVFDMIKAVVTGFAVLNVAMYLLKFPYVSRGMIAIFVALNVLLLAISKSVIYTVLNRYRKSSYNVQNIVLVGSGEGAEAFVDIVHSRYPDGYRILGCVDEGSEKIGKRIGGDVEIVCSLDSLETLLTGNSVDEVIFTMPMDKLPEVEAYILLAEKMGINVRFLPEWLIQPVKLNPMIGSLRIENFLEIPTLTLKTTPNHEGMLFIKNALDYLMGVIFLLLSLPLFPIIAAGIMLSSKGPVFFRQNRSGLNGRQFTFYKFRTMQAEAERTRHDLDDLNEADGPVFKIKKDPRIIPGIGPILRASGLDELPQLFNVLKGEMSLVGPRPPIPEEVEKYDVWQRRRLSMKPGMTCLWQVSKNRNYMEFKEWMNLDLEYIDNWSLWLDAKIIMKTIVVLAQYSGH